MKVYVLYHPNSDQARPVEEFIHEFDRVYGRAIELLSLETREGAAMASLYDVVRYPALIALREDGQIYNTWEGLPLPLMDEVAAGFTA
jgi:hypothetical protein